MAKKRTGRDERSNKVNYSISTYAAKLTKQDDYSSARAIAAALDMERRGTLPIVSPPKVSQSFETYKKEIERDQQKAARDHDRMREDWNELYFRKKALAAIRKSRKKLKKK